MISNKTPILVIGGNGYIGSTVVEKLLQQNFKVRVLDKFLYGKDILKDFMPNKNLELIEGDVSNIFSLITALKDVQCVVHLAGIVGDAAGSIDPKLTNHVNVVSTRIIRDTMKAMQIPRLIFASSCSVYGITTGVSNEHSKLFPVSIYAETKIESEKDLLSEKIDNFHPTILRFATVFGHSRKPRFDLVANLFTAKAYYDEPLHVSNGTQWRPFIHVTDLARSIIAVIMSPQETVSRQVFNVGDQRNHLQIHELAELVKDVVSKDKMVKIIMQNKMEDKRDYRVSFKKIKNNLGFEGTINVRQGIEEMYENFKNEVYKSHYTDPFYSNLEMTKVYQKEFYTDYYKRHHLSEISIGDTKKL